MKIARVINALVWLYLWLSAVSAPLPHPDPDFWAQTAQQAVSLHPAFVNAFHGSAAGWGYLVGHTLFVVTSLLLIDWRLRRAIRRRARRGERHRGATLGRSEPRLAHLAARAQPQPADPSPAVTDPYEQSTTNPVHFSQASAMGFGEAVRTCFSKYATFSGRARRSEYWLFWLFVAIAEVVGALIDGAAGTDIVAGIIWLVLLLPNLAVFVRRLHDIDRTGWWVLLPLVPIIVIPLIVSIVVLVLGRVAGGVAAPAYFTVWHVISLSGLVALVLSIVLLVWCCKRGTLGPNRYGTDPLTPTLSAATSSRSEVQPSIIEAQRSASRLNIVAMHWRGLYPLWVSYWVIGFLLNGLAVVVETLANSLQPKSGYYNPLAIFATVTSIWICILAIGIWQVVGTWRSANSYAARRSSIGRKSSWALVAKISLSFNVIGLVATFLSSGLPMLSATTRMAFMGDPDIPAYSLRIMRDGTEVAIKGGIKYGLADDLSLLLKASPQVRVVHLNSPGGRIGEAEKLYNLVRKKGIAP